MISNDPGEPKTGATWAQFVGKDLYKCGIWGFHPPPIRLPGERVLIELPLIYARSPVPPNDICTLSRRAGRIEHALCAWDELAEWVPATTWKGSVNKVIMTERILSALPESDRIAYFRVAAEVAESYQHNLLDAIGLGRWALKLMGRGGIRLTS